MLYTAVHYVIICHNKTFIQFIRLHFASFLNPSWSVSFSIKFYAKYHAIRSKSHISSWGRVLPYILYTSRSIISLSCANKVKPVKGIKLYYFTENSHSTLLATFTFIILGLHTLREDNILLPSHCLLYSLSHHTILIVTYIWIPYKCSVGNK